MVRKKSPVKRAVSVTQLLGMKFKLMDFEGPFYDLIGTPERSGSWIIWANSGNGKTNFSIQLAKYLTNFGRVAYDTMEEGARRSFQRAIQISDLSEVSRKILILNREPIEDLCQRLTMRKSPDIVFIDSFQYSGLNRSSYIDLKETFPNKLFLFVSHAEGKNPLGRAATFVRYDADVKIRVEGYRAFATSRYGGNNEPYVIWEEGSYDYWGE
jgi:hypothetical protein